MRDRLIELLDESSEYINLEILKSNCDEKLSLLDQITEVRADYLLANGVVCPPCKVGDKIYAISENRIAECTCDEINIHNEVTICAEFQCDYDCKGCPFNTWKQDFHTGEYSCDGEYGTWFFSLKDFGKTVFLTKEEARAKLEEGAE